MNHQFAIYFHRDFDGICSAALLSELLPLTKDSEYREFLFIGVDYDIKSSWLAEELEKPNAVVDFLFHPNAQWWFDHHSTSFLDSRHEQSFTNNKKQSWNQSYRSCPSLIRDHFIRYYQPANSKVFDRFEEWISWSDKIDSAAYVSPQELIELQHPCLQINSSLLIDTSSDYLQFLINQIRKKQPSQVAELKQVRFKVHKYRQTQMKIIDQFKNIITVEDSMVAYFDQSGIDVPFQRYLSYYFYPNVNYTIGVYQKQNDSYSVSVGKNPWKTFDSKHIGEICKKYGGGGRHDVGAIITVNHDQARSIADEIKNSLIT